MDTGSGTTPSGTTQSGTTPGGTTQLDEAQSERADAARRGGGRGRRRSPARAERVVRTRAPTVVADDLAYLRIAVVNVTFYGPRDAGDRNWVLIDTGLPGSADRIARAAAARFGAGARPSGIVLTHGHFDHVGAVRELSERWDAPVWAHWLELPYLTGRSPYPPPDPTVGGGAMAALSRLYPRRPVNLGERVQALPGDGSVPGMPEWRWIPTPGHTPGHVSLFRERDRALIAGDAFVTTKVESVIAVLEQRKEIHGPPAYYTPDWPTAKQSVQRLDELDPLLAVTGHGRPMAGQPLRSGLRRLAREFDRLGVPRRGRYVGRPVVSGARGVVAVPPAAPDPLPKILAGIGAVLVAGGAVRMLRSWGRSRG